MRIVDEETAPRFFAGPLDCPPIPCPAICELFGIAVQNGLVLI